MFPAISSLGNLLLKTDQFLIIFSKICAFANSDSTAGIITKPLPHTITTTEPQSLSTGLIVSINR